MRCIVSQPFAASSVIQPLLSPAEPSDRALGERRHATVTASIYAQLRLDVLTGRLRPGQKLGAVALRHRFQSGSSPIREALNRLLAEGLVALEEQKGFRVAPISRKDLHELMMARVWIDSAAVYESIARFDTRWEETLILTLHRLNKTPRYGNDEPENSRWRSLLRDLHLALINGCGTNWIVHISEQLFDAAERYQLLVPQVTSQHAELHEWGAIINACMEQHADAAVDLLKRRYLRIHDTIATSLAMP